MPVYCVSRISHMFLHLICAKNPNFLRVKLDVSSMEVDVSYF